MLCQEVEVAEAIQEAEASEDVQEEVVLDTLQVQAIQAMAIQAMVIQATVIQATVIQIMDQVLDQDHIIIMEDQEDTMVQAEIVQVDAHLP